MNSEDAERPVERFCDVCGCRYTSDEDEIEIFLEPAEVEEYRRHSDFFCIHCFEKRSGKPVKHKTPGLRHRVVHEGVRLEQILPDEQRLTLWRELDGYLRPILDRMMMHSTSTWADYSKIREHAFTHLQGGKKPALSGDDEEDIPF